jgi:hypothetical protein
MTHAVPEHADSACFHAQLTRDLDVALAGKFQRVNLRLLSVWPRDAAALFIANTPCSLHRHNPAARQSALMVI